MNDYNPNGYTTRQAVLKALENHRNGGKDELKDKKKGDSAEEGKTPLKSSPTKPEEA